MLPYTSKFYSNGTIFDSVGNINEKYISVHYTPTDIYYLRHTTGLVAKYNIVTEEETDMLCRVATDTLSTFSVVLNQGTLYGFRGYKATPFKDDSVLYIMDNNQLVYETYDYQTRNVLLSSGTSIRDFVVNHDLNYYVIHGDSKITKFNKDRVYQYTLFAASSASGLSSILPASETAELLSVDYVREYVNGVAREYPIVLGKISTGQLFLTKIDEANTSFSSTKMLEASGTYYKFGDNRKINYNLTNYNFLRQQYDTDTNTLNFKLTLKNVYNNRDIVRVDIPVDVSHYTVGYHHFAFRIDTMHGKLTLFVDGREYKSVKIPAADYAFQDIAHGSLCVGATYFYNNIPLFKKLKQPTHYVVDNCSIKQFKIYDKALSDNEIRFLTYNNTKMGDLVISLPCGQRNEVDTIERVFSFNVPGSKSNNINIVIKNSNITDPNIQNQVKSVILEQLKKILPINTKINEISFKNSMSTFNSRLST